MKSGNVTREQQGERREQRPGSPVGLSPDSPAERNERKTCAEVHCGDKEADAENPREFADLNQGQVAPLRGSEVIPREPRHDPAAQPFEHAPHSRICEHEENSVQRTAERRKFRAVRSAFQTIRRRNGKMTPQKIVIRAPCRDEKREHERENERNRKRNLPQPEEAEETPEISPRQTAQKRAPHRAETAEQNQRKERNPCEQTPVQRGEHRRRARTRHGQSGMQNQRTCPRQEKRMLFRKVHAPAPPVKTIVRFSCSMMRFSRCALTARESTIISTSRPMRERSSGPYS